jgi:hypothetical protein
MYSRGQHERTATRHHRNSTRRTCFPPRPSLHPRISRALLYRSRHASVITSRLQSSQDTANRSIATHLCSVREPSEDVVLDWHVEELQSTVHGDREDQALEGVHRGKYSNERTWTCLQIWCQGAFLLTGCNISMSSKLMLFKFDWVGTWLSSDGLCFALFSHGQ